MLSRRPCRRASSSRDGSTRESRRPAKPVDGPATRLDSWSRVARRRRAPRARIPHRLPGMDSGRPVWAAHSRKESVPRLAWSCVGSIEEGCPERLPALRQGYPTHHGRIHGRDRGGRRRWDVSEAGQRACVDLVLKPEHKLADSRHDSGVGRRVDTAHRRGARQGTTGAGRGRGCAPSARNPSKMMAT